MSAKKNKSMNALPRFIWGEAVSEAGFSAREYLVHTRYPRFICEVYEGEAVRTEPGKFQGVLSLHPTDGDLIYCTDLDVHLRGFVFLDKGGVPEDAVIKAACDDAILNYMMRDDEYGINDDE